MMMLIEETYLPETALPVEALKRHLRLGTGFSEDDLQDEVLAAFLRAAIAAIEGRTGKALITRQFVVTADGWDTEISLPIAPVTQIESVAKIGAQGEATPLDASAYGLKADPHAPRVLRSVQAVGGHNGSFEIRFSAGYGEVFEEIPADLAQAVLMLAAHYYAHREDTGLGQGCMPFGVTSLVARYRPLRIGFAS